MVLTSLLVSVLTCISEHPGARLGGGPILIQGLLEGSPQLVDMDAATESVSSTESQFEFIAHNGCDNFYRVSFSQSDLNALKTGKSTSVTGELEFFNADVEETITSLTCSLR